MENSIIKVCVRIPMTQKEKLMEFAKELRSEHTDKGPGWDSKAIHNIAKKNYGDLNGLFESQNWDERGKKMLPNVQRRVKNDFGTIENFVELHSNFDGRLFQVQNPEDGRNILIRISGTALAMRSEEVCKTIGLKKLSRGLFGNDGSVHVSSYDITG